MNKQSKKLSAWKHYIAKEIGIEFKSCLYFFCILFFYCVYRLLHGNDTAQILHMTQMICVAYAMGYIQMYFLANFDEAEKLRIKELLCITFCSAAYALFSLLFKWFDRSAAAATLFAFYMTLVYLCAFFVYKSKREMDSKRLNEDLKYFQERSQHNVCNRN